jgi:tripartite-type tricarboxylate transporter receptor subunit TctC
MLFGGNTMKLPHRRQILHLAAGAAALSAVSRMAWAQPYPSLPVRLIVPAPAGGTGDLLARIAGQWLSEHLGQQFIVDNRPGASGNVATEAVVRASADGYTLLLVFPSNATNATLYDKLSFNFIRDVTPVAGLMQVPNMVVVHPSLPVKTVPELIAYAKANPGKLNMASGGVGTLGGHIAGELFKMMAGIEMVHVPYRGNVPALTDLLSGQVQVMVVATSSALEYVRAGKLRPLAVTSMMRLNELPDVPTMSEFLPGYQTSSWYGVGAPRNTPTEIVNVLNRNINVALADPNLKARLGDLGGTTLPGSPADFGKLIADETDKWAKVIRAANIKPE